MISFIKSTAIRKANVAKFEISFESLNGFGRMYLHVWVVALVDGRDVLGLTIPQPMDPFGLRNRGIKCFVVLFVDGCTIYPPMLCLIFAQCCIEAHETLLVYAMPQSLRHQILTAQNRRLIKFLRFC